MKRGKGPVELAAACLDAAWRDDIADDVRQLLERSSDTITHMLASIRVMIDERAELQDRLVSQAKVLEVVEAEMASMKFPLLGDDPGMGL